MRNTSSTQSEHTSFSGRSEFKGKLIGYPLNDGDNKMIAKLAALLLGAGLLIGFGVSSEAASLGYSRAAIETPSEFVVKTVTRVGVAHRSARRTARRVNRRHSY